MCYGSGNCPHDLEHLDELGPALIEIYEASPAPPIKIGLRDRLVCIIRRKRRPYERVRAIADPDTYAAEAVNGRQERKCWPPELITRNCPAHRTAAVIAKASDLRGCQIFPTAGTTIR